MQKSILREVINNELCLGCGACSVAFTEKNIVMRENRNGFLRPTIVKQLTNNDEEIFSSICPGLKINQSDENLDAQEILWGPIKSINIAWSTEPSTRFKASSGGGISSTAIWLLENDLADAVLHVKVSEENPLKNDWTISTNREQIIQNAGSRYSPAAPLLGLVEATKKFSRIVFIGKPCDIVGAKRICSINPDINKKIKFYISFMCAGTPSNIATEKTIKKLGVNIEDVLEFKYRGDGWPGDTTAKTKTGEKYTMTYKESWGGILNKHLQLRCKICIDGTGEEADITYGDAWHGTSDGYPDFSEQEGRSIAIARTKIGQEILNSMQKSNSIHLEKSSLRDLELMQPYQASRKKLLLSRIVAMKMVGLKPPIYSYKKLLALANKIGIKENLVSFAGMLRRSIKIKKLLPNDTRRSQT